MKFMYTKDNIPRMYIVLCWVNHIGMVVLTDRKSDQLRASIARYADKKWPTIS